MDQMLFVQFGSRLAPLKLSTIQAWFPVWGDGRVDTSPLIESIASKISGRVPGVNAYNSVQEIERVLHQLFQELNPGLFGDIGEESKKERVVNMLSSCLNTEMYSPLTPSLPRSRSRFLILCLVAKQTISTRLAEAALQFYITHIQQIVGSENPTSLHEWNSALNELRELVSADAIDRAKRYATSSGTGMTFPRSSIRNMDFAYGTPMASPLDGMFGRVGLGPSVRPGWRMIASPLSPGIMSLKPKPLFDTPFLFGGTSHSSASIDEVDRLRIRQAEITGEVHGIRRHIELMRHG